ncbi:hypothetical protein ACRRTK_023559 [Alexandromys fortis]
MGMTVKLSKGSGNVEAYEEILRSRRLWRKGLEGGSALPQRFLVALGPVCPKASF